MAHNKKFDALKEITNADFFSTVDNHTFSNETMDILKLQMLAQEVVRTQLTEPFIKVLEFLV